VTPETDRPAEDGAAMLAHTPVTHDPEQIERYYRVLLNNASEGGRLELRAFYDDKRGGTFKL
jgi:hypothetical protein